MLTRKIALPEPVDEADEALQLTWIEPPKPLVLPIPAAATDDPRPAPTTVRKTPVRATTHEATPAAAPVPARSMRAILIEQARQTSGPPDVRAAGRESGCPAASNWVLAVSI